MPPGEPPAPDDKAARIVLIDRPGASQSNVAVALPGVPRTSKDFDAILMMNTILGGQFSSRLNMNLREKHAYTYGAGSCFDFRHGAGPFRAGGAIVRESTEPAIREMLTEIERMRTELVIDEELADAKANVIKQLPARFETAGATAATLASLAIYGLPLDEFATRPARLQKVTREDVKRVADVVPPAGRASASWWWEMRRSSRRAWPSSGPSSTWGSRWKPRQPRGRPRKRAARNQAGRSRRRCGRRPAVIEESPWKFI